MGNPDLGSIFQIEIVLIFLFAGIIKGLIGLGVPMITLSLMSLFQPVPSAVVITLLPSFLTNVWQGGKGGNFIKLSMKLWGLVVMVPPGVWIGTYFLDKFELPWFSVILGGLLIIFGVLSLSGIDLQVPEGQENYWGILVGIVGGLMLGMTGIFSVPSVFYLYGLKLNRDELVQALGIVLNIVTVFLAIALYRMGMLYEKQLLLSIGALFGTVCGMVIGQQIRRHIPEGLFRKIFLSFLMVLGTYIITNALHELGILNLSEASNPLIEFNDA